MAIQNQQFVTIEQYEKLQKDFEKFQKQIDRFTKNPFLPDHYHTGTDVSQVNYANLYQKKVYVYHTIVGTDAATATNYGVFYIVPFQCIVNVIKEVHMTLGTDGSAVTLTIEKLTGTQALDAGVSTLSSTIDLRGTINTVVTPTLTTTNADRNLAIGDRLSMKDAGTLTAVANVTIMVELLLTP
jgi:hypothetical protein